MSKSLGMCCFLIRAILTSSTAGLFGNVYEMVHDSHPNVATGRVYDLKIFTSISWYCGIGSLSCLTTVSL